jgi:hypothetical protein
MRLLSTAQGDPLIAPANSAFNCAERSSQLLKLYTFKVQKLQAPPCHKEFAVEMVARQRLLGQSF